MFKPGSSHIYKSKNAPKFICGGVLSLILFAYSGVPAFAQTASTNSNAPATQGGPDFSTINKNAKKSFVTVSYENDLIGSGEDKYYTSGFQLNYFNVDRRPPEILRGVADNWLGFDVSKATSTSYVFGQKIFTPSDITVAAAQPNDRPWAGWLYGGFTLSNIYDDYADSLGIIVGVVGPPSLAEHTQKFIHKNVTDSPYPEGWDNQLHTEIGGILTWQRRWLNFWGTDVGNYRFQAEPSVNAALGNIYTNAGAGFTVTFGPNQKELRDTPPRLYPAMPGTGYFDLPKDEIWDWYTFAGVNGRVVARDIFLDGNTFRDSPSVDKKNLVYDLNAGVAFTIKDVRLSYTMVYRSKEFDTQDDPSIFGSVSASYRF